MNIERTKKIFRFIVWGIIVFSSLVFGVFIYVFLTKPQIIPIGETFGSFWIKNFSLLIAALAFASSALAAAYNAIEQRHLRYMENYPFLEIFPIWSVDPLPLPVPKFDLPPELSSFNKDYMKDVAPGKEIESSDTEFRYLALYLRNVGHGYVTRATIKGKAIVPGRGYPPADFIFDRRVNLNPGDFIPFTILPISGLPEYKVLLESVEYYGHFTKLSDYDGKNEIEETFPFIVPPEQTDNIFYDDFDNIPAGQGWVLDFWGKWGPTNYIYVPHPVENNHFLVLSGDSSLFSQIPHYNNQGGAHKDLMDILSYGMSVRVSAKVKSLPETTAKIQLWCHDLAPNPKSRQSDAITPGQEWEEISIIYTSTQTHHIRVHLLYTPGIGEILVDSVTVDNLFT